MAVGFVSFFLFQPRHIGAHPNASATAPQSPTTEQAVVVRSRRAPAAPTPQLLHPIAIPSHPPSAIRIVSSSASQAMSTYSSQKKARAPAHQNVFAFRHNPKSKKTEKILAMPNEVRVCVCGRAWIGWDGLAWVDASVHVPFYTPPVIRTITGPVPALPRQGGVAQEVPQVQAPDGACVHACVHVVCVVEALSRVDPHRSTLSEAA